MSHLHKQLGLLALLCSALLLVSACGKEAPPRAASTSRTPTAQPTGRAQPTAQPTAGAATAPIEQRRALGDPSAPVTVIEYGDYQ